MRARPSRTSSSFRGPMPRNEYRPSRSPPSTDSRRYAGVVPSSRRRNAPMGVSRSAERVARSSSVSAFATSRFAWARLSGSVVVTCGASGAAASSSSAPRIETTSRPRDERSSLPRCHPHSALPHFPDRQGSNDRRSALPAIAGALRRSLLGVRTRLPFGPEAPGSIRRRRRPGFHQPPGLSADARRVLVPFTARISI